MEILTCHIQDKAFTPTACKLKRDLIRLKNMTGRNRTCLNARRTQVTIPNIYTCGTKVESFLSVLL